jgi:hypothetical protein
MVIFEGLYINIKQQVEVLNKTNKKKFFVKYMNFISLCLVIKNYKVS